VLSVTGKYIMINYFLEKYNMFMLWRDGLDKNVMLSLQRRGVEMGSVVSDGASIWQVYVLIFLFWVCVFILIDILSGNKCRNYLIEKLGL
jgi:hypothetical protein